MAKHDVPLKAPPELATELSKELQNDSDRTVAVTAAAYLDHLLKFLIAKNMKVAEEEVLKLLFGGGQAPLGTFSSREARH